MIAGCEGKAAKSCVLQQATRSVVPLLRSEYNLNGFGCL